MPSAAQRRTSATPAAYQTSSASRLVSICPAPSKWKTIPSLIGQARVEVGGVADELDLPVGRDEQPNSRGAEHADAARGVLPLDGRHVQHVVATRVALGRPVGRRWEDGEHPGGEATLRGRAEP